MQCLNLDFSAYMHHRTLSNLWHSLILFPPPPKKKKKKKKWTEVNL